MTRRLLQLLAATFVLSAGLLIPRRMLDAQAPTGRVVGRIIDVATGQGLSDVGVQVVGTTLGTMSGVDGRFAIADVPAGTVTIHVRRLGYQPKTVTGIVLDAGATVQQDVGLEPATVQLQTLEVTASAERGTVSEALDRQRTATGIVNAVTSEQIARSPDGDAAAAVQRVSGVTVQDGKYVFVRGLGERYTTTSLNGARIPSPEPEKKVVPLDLFPSSLLQTITTAKTFTPDLPGDFSGAQVDIQTREFPARRSVTYTAAMGYNTAATGRTLLAAPTVGREWLGFGGAERSLPGFVRAAEGSFGSGLAQSDVNQVIRSFRDSWSPRQARGVPAYSLGASVGGEDPVFGHRVGYIASTTYQASQDVHVSEVEGFAVATGDASNPGFAPYNRFTGSTGTSSVLWGGLLNLSTSVGTHTHLSFNNTYNRSADNLARQDSGYFEELAFPIRRTTLSFVERSVRSNQLRGAHVIGTQQELAWSVTSSGVSRREPDRSDIVYGREVDPATGAYLPLAWLAFKAEGARRSFSDLTERSTAPAADYTLRLGAPARLTTLKVGGAWRHTTRDATNDVYDILSTRLPQSQRTMAPEEIFDGRYTRGDTAILQVRNSGTGGAYGATEDVSAGYAMVKQALGTRLELVGGARVEQWTLDMTVESTTEGNVAIPRKRSTDVLPSLIANVTLSGAQNLRFSASRTLSRPEYREIAPVEYSNGLARLRMVGNPALGRALVQNYDTRWEWYPNPDEVLSVGLFAKRFTDPIEQVEVATSGVGRLTYINARSASNYGLEVEARKNLGWIAHRFEGLHLFANATVMKSEINTSNDSLGALQNDRRPMVGQSPYVVNAGLTYTSATGAGSATILYNVVGKRIVSAGTVPLPDTYEQPRNVVDLSLRFPLFGSTSGRLDLKNLLDAPYLTEQGGVIRSRWEAGRVVSFGIAVRP